MSITATIAISTTIGGTYTANAALRLDSLRLRLFPALSTAAVSHEYGAIAEGQTRAVEAPLDLRGNFIQITITDGTSTQTWTGYCPALTEDIRQTHPNPYTPTTANIPSARQTFAVYGLDYFLDRPITGLYATHGRVENTLPFNRSADGLITGNRSAAVDPSSLVYVFDHTNTDRWDALTVANHLIDTLAQETGITFAWAASGSQHATLLPPIQRIWDFHGLTYRDALRQLISPEFGAALIVDGLALRAVSILDTALSADLPANPSVFSIDLENTPTIERAILTHLENAHYDRITVRGERLRVTWTVTVADGDLVADWDATDQATYIAQQPFKKNDDERLRHVFRRFVLADSYNPQWPQIDETSGGLLPAGSYQAYYPPTDGLNQDLTLFLGTAITDATDQYPLLVWVQNPADATELMRVDRPGNGLPASGTSVLRDRPGILLRPPYGHAFAGTLMAGNAAVGSPPPTFDYATLVATITADTNDRTRITLAAAAAEPGPVTREKIIDIPEAHYWIALPSTRYGTNSTMPASISVLRDDTDLLANIAAMAQAWYGRPRATIQVSYNTPLVLDWLGRVVKDTRAAGTLTPAGTILTSIDYELTGQRQDVSIRTEHLQLDFAQRYADSARARNARHHQRPVAAREPVRDNHQVKVRITGLHADTTSLGGNEFVGNIYDPAFPDGPIRVTGATIMIPDLSPSYEGPPSGDFSDIPLLSAIATPAVWTGATATHQETVYRITDPYRWY